MIPPWFPHWHGSLHRQAANHHQGFAWRCGHLWQTSQGTGKIRKVFFAGVSQANFIFTFEFQLHWLETAPNQFALWFSLSLVDNTWSEVGLCWFTTISTCLNRSTCLKPGGQAWLCQPRLPCSPWWTRTRNVFGSPTFWRHFWFR